MAEFSQSEVEVIEDLSLDFQADIDLARVAELIQSEQFSAHDFRIKLSKDPALRKEATPEIWAATAVQMGREVEKKVSAGKAEEAERILRLDYIISAESEAQTGLDLIKTLDEFLRLKPTVEAIFSQDDQQLEKSYNYVNEFSETDYESTLIQNKRDLMNLYQEWEKEDLSTESINQGIEIYQKCSDVFERGFPNLLALKRILDGQEPSVDVLQRKSASSVRRELTEGEPGSNSAYFDLIVNAFDNSLRNGIAHNDLITDPGKSEVRIPSKGFSYSYENFNEIVTENLANAIFLTGAFRSLIEWHAITSNTDYRDPRPDWVFDPEPQYQTNSE